MPYKTQSPDTSEEFEKAYFALLRQKTPAERLRLAIGHVDGCISRARRQIARQHPEWSEQEVALHWAELMYGTEQVDRVRQYLSNRESSDHG